MRITQSMYFWLAMYFATNLGLTLYNKAILQIASFHFPFMLTAVHCFFSFIGAYIVTKLSPKKEALNPEVTSMKGSVILISFSVLYTINIAISNLSLDLVTLAFHQLVRSTTPVFAVIISLVFSLKTFSRAIYLSLIPVVLGVALATYGDLSWTALGFFLTVLGTFLAALKTVATNLVLVGNMKLQPMDLLWRMSFLAFFQCIVYSYFSGELQDMLDMLSTSEVRVYWFLIGNGLSAFALNYVSFTTNKLSSALTMTVAANVKQVLAIILAIIVFNTHVSALNAFGILVTLAGGAQYTLVEYRENQEKKRQGELPRN